MLVVNRYVMKELIGITERYIEVLELDDGTYAVKGDRNKIRIITGEEFDTLSKDCILPKLPQW